MEAITISPSLFLKKRGDNYVDASDQHNYANSIKMIKGVHQLTLRQNMLISLINQ